MFGSYATEIRRGDERVNVNRKIEEILDNLVEGHIWPLVCPEAMNPDKYIVYNPELEEPGYYADDEDQEWLHNMQIHLYVRGNYLALRKKIRSLLRKNDFTISDIVTLYEKDTGFSHLIFSCTIEEENEEWQE